jgi:hypothetical protein
MKEIERVVLDPELAWNMNLFFEIQMIKNEIQMIKKILLTKGIRI